MICMVKEEGAGPVNEPGLVLGEPIGEDMLDPGLTPMAYCFVRDDDGSNEEPESCWPNSFTNFPSTLAPSKR